MMNHHLRFRGNNRVCSWYSSGNRGFTLFEVSISLALVAFGVVSILMLLPSGVKAQQMARFQIYAAAKAEEMIEQFVGDQGGYHLIQA